MSYTPPAGNAVAFNFSGIYAAPAGNALAFNFTNATAGSSSGRGFTEALGHAFAKPFGKSFVPVKP